MNFIKKLIEGCYITGTLLPFLENYFSDFTRRYWALKKEEVLNLRIFVLFSFRDCVILGGHILNISKTIFRKLIFHGRVSDQVHDVLL